MTLLQEELAPAGAMPRLAPAGTALSSRFGYYQGLARLPRRLRCVLQRRWRRSLGGLALLCARPWRRPSTWAGACTSVHAITAANTDAPAGDCTAGSGADTLILPAGSTHPLTVVNNRSSYGPNGLPLVTSTITIPGNGSTITGEPN